MSDEFRVTEEELEWMRQYEAEAQAALDMYDLAFPEDYLSGMVEATKAQAEDEAGDG